MVGRTTARNRGVTRSKSKTVSTLVGSPKDKGSHAYYCSFYNTLSEFEHHFDTMELEVRKIASYWLAGIFAAIAFVIRGELGPAATLVSSASLLCLIALFGNVGLFALWSLDQRVYHSLLNAAFRIGLQVERLCPEIPPVRSQMWANSAHSGMGRFQVLFYVLPMGVIGLVALLAAARAGLESTLQLVLLIPAFTSLLIPSWIASKRLRALHKRLIPRPHRPSGSLTEAELAERRLTANANAVLERWRASIPELK